MSITILPSLPAQSFAEINALAEVLRGVVSELQVDLVDGQFVPLVSWPFTEPDPVQALLQLGELTSEYALEIDCMVREPEQYLEAFATIAPKRVIIHLGSTTAHEELHRHARQHNYKLGLAFTNDQSLTEVEALLPLYDYVQVMGIAAVGQQGQAFDERTLDTIATLNAKYPALEVAVDGAVNATTIPLLKAAGADRFAPGSAIAKQTDPRSAFLALKAIAEA